MNWVDFPGAGARTAPHEFDMGRAVGFGREGNDASTGVLLRAPHGFGSELREGCRATAVKLRVRPELLESTRSRRMRRAISQLDEQPTGGFGTSRRVYVADKPLLSLTTT